jgi:outer membrane protein OmpA-like peptidoglycan-associated protein
MPKWNPGSTNGKTVKVYYTLPITFTLPKSSPQFTKVKSNTTTTITNIFDRDDDGVINDKDKCPDIAGSIFAQGCPDRDGDGLMDVDDKCPDVPGPASNKGCPILIEETKSKPPIFTSRNIQFESGKDIIKPTSYIILDEVAEVLKQYPYYTLNIGGHTDNAESYNSDAAQSLSQSRSVNVMNYLIKKGVSPDKLTAFGYGQTKPIADNKTTTGRSQNRRVELNLNFK